MAKPEELSVEGLTFTPIVKKDSKFKGWNSKGLSWDEAVEEVDASNGYYTGLGLVHGTSGTCCLDIDDVDAAIDWFRRNHGIDNIMDHLHGHFEVLSPNSRTGKFMFKLPPSMRSEDQLRYTDNNWWVHDTIPEIKLEFMAGSRQDAWPGSRYWDKRENRYNGVYTHRGSVELLDLPLDLFKIWKERQVQKAEQKISDGSSSTNQGSHGEHTRAQLYNFIMTGENYHDSLKSLSLGMVKDFPNMSSSEIFDILSAVVIGSQPVGEDRQGSKQRVMHDGWKELWDLIKGARKFVEDEELAAVSQISAEMMNEKIEEKDDGINFREIPWPPGRMGELAQAAYNFQRYQYREMAVVSAIGLIAGVCGRKFNVSHPSTGLNVYMTVLGPTGIGKGSIEKFINQVLLNQSGIGKDISFIGNNDFTSGTVLIKSLQNARCQISITDEAGQSLSSKSGDPQKKILTLLDLYSKSGHDDWAMNQGQREQEHSTSKLKGAAFSWINISTPEVFKREFYQQGSVSNGLAPRMSIYSIDDITLTKNRHPELIISQDIIDRLDYLIKECSKIQALDDFKVWQFELNTDLEDEADELEMHYRGIMRDLRHIDVNKSDMHNRAYLKVLKFAALATALNKTKDDPTSLVIDRDEWEWAKAMVDYEMANIDSFFSGKYFGNSLGDAINVVRNTIFKLFSDKHDVKEKAGNLSLDMRAKNIFNKTALYRRLKSNTTLKEIDDDPKFKSKPKSGLDKCLEAMCESGAIKETRYGNRNGKYYQLLEGIMDEI